MHNDRPLQCVENALILALYERIFQYKASKGEKIKQELQKTEWGKKLLDVWEDIESFGHVWKALGEQVDKGMEPLVSVFSQLRIMNSNTASQLSYYEPKPWQEAVCYPSYSKPTTSDLADHWEEIANSWLRWIRKAPNELESRLAHFLDWGDKWLAAVPVSRDLNSVSLAMHFRLMAALIVACGEGTSFRLVIGDISGIQKYLMDIAHIGAGKVAKRLRARSFLLGLLADSAAHELLLEAKMPMFNLLLSAGGIFYAILPESYSIQEWQHQINHYYYKRYHGFICLNTASKSVQLQDVNESFPHILNGLYQEIQKVKGTPFVNILTSEEGKWSENVFIHHSNEQSEPCASCRKFPRFEHVKNTEGFCQACFLDEEIGRILPKAKYLLFKRNEGMISLGKKVSVDVLSELPRSLEEGYFLQVWNQVEVLGVNIPFQRKWVANYVPLLTEKRKETLEKHADPNDKLEVRSPLTFGQIATLGQGRDLLGYLKADVDNLGMLFSVGLIPEDEQCESQRTYTFSHIVTLSKLLERFFSGGMNKWLWEKYHLTYTVFSGGDDLFLIGPWSEILFVAEEVRKNFSQYVLNPQVSLSAGIDIVRAKFPITHASHQVEDLLKAAKDEPNCMRIRKGIDNGRNQVSLIGTTMEWSSFKDIRDEAIRIANWWNEKKLSSSFLYQLVNFSHMYQMYKQKGENEYLKFVPMLHYSIRRNLIDSLDVVTNQWSMDNEESIHWAKSLQNIYDDKVDWTWEYMRTIVRLSSFYREGA